MDTTEEKKTQTLDEEEKAPVLALDNEDDEKMVTLQSAEEKKFSVKRKHAKISKLVAQALDTDGTFCFSL